jgi:hypothetical protein
MSYDEGLAFRIRELLGERADLSEKAMFGGLAFLIGGNMSVAASSQAGLLVRVGPERHEEALSRPHTRIMEFTGRSLKGWIYVDPPGYERDRDLEQWVEWGVACALVSPKKPLKEKPAKAAKKAPAKKPASKKRR